MREKDVKRRYNLFLFRLLRLSETCGQAGITMYGNRTNGCASGNNKKGFKYARTDAIPLPAPKFLRHLGTRQDPPKVFPRDVPNDSRGGTEIGNTANKIGSRSLVPRELPTGFARMEGGFGGPGAECSLFALGSARHERCIPMGQQFRI